MNWMNIVEYFCNAVHTMPEAAFCFKFFGFDINLLFYSSLFNIFHHHIIFP